MSNRHFQQSMTDREAIRESLSSEGIGAGQITGQMTEAVRDAIGGVMSYVAEGGEVVSRMDVVRQYGETEDAIERLHLLKDMDIADAVKCIRQHGSTGGKRYLEQRLEFYEKLINGKATKKEKQWTGSSYEDREVFIDNSTITPHTIRQGLLRDIMQAAMIDTPEFAIYRVAMKRCKAAERKTAHMPTLKGYHSGIFPYGKEVGAYADLRRVYEAARRYVERRRGGTGMTEEELEHRAVMTAAGWLEKSMEYNDPNRSPHSPYVSEFEEQIAWARLGSQVQRQLRGMRRKIQGVDLHNMGRFIGKSGANPYLRVVKDLKAQLEEAKRRDLDESRVSGPERQRLIEEHQQLEDELGVLGEWTAPASDRGREVSERLAIIDEQLSPGREVARVETLLQRAERRCARKTSLAQRAIDLHFAINHTGGNYDYEQRPPVTVDWINYAPLGTIKRAHRMLKQGVDKEQIVVCALATIIAGKRGMTRADVRFVQDLYAQGKTGDQGAAQTLDAMQKVGNIVSHFGYELSLDEVADLAGKNFHGLTGALRLYSLDDVRKLMDGGMNLQSIATVRETTQRRGLDLPLDQVVEMATHDIEGLETALRNLDLDAVRTLLRQDVKLPVAVAVLNNTRQVGYDLTVAQIATIAKNMHDVDDFVSALRGLPLADVEQLFKVGITYQDFRKVRDTLAAHQYPADFAATLAVAGKLLPNREYENLDPALNIYSLAEVEIIVGKRVALTVMLEVRNALEEKQISLGLEETILFAQHAGYWSQGWLVKQAIETFGLDDTRKIIAGGCQLDKALEAKRYISGTGSSLDQQVREALSQGGLDVIIAMGRAGDMRTVARTLEAGFTVEEIVRFPFLISKLTPAPAANPSSSLTPVVA